MSEVGVEVGQKMRSAIKAKLTELDCYVDDELPDYIMVMIANKRTKSQMKEDLNLFLSTKTSQFVEWLHIVLKKLKEVQVTNPDVFKNPLKRKPDYTISQEDFKKVKKEKLKKIKKEEHKKSNVDENKSLTDDLPITANKLSEARKIVIMNEGPVQNNVEIDEHDFNIPLLSEINASNEEELQLIEQRIKSVKSRLGLQVESDEDLKEDDNEDEEDSDEDMLTIKPDPGDLLFTSENPQIPSNELSKSPKSPKTPKSPNKTTKITREVSMERTPSPLLRELPKKSIHDRITFNKEKDSLKAKADLILKQGNSSPNKKKSVLERLGTRQNQPRESTRDPREPKDKDVRDIRHRLSQLRNKESQNERNSQNMKNLKNSPNEKSNAKNTKSNTKIVKSTISIVKSKVSIPPKRPKSPLEEIDEAEELKRSRKDVESVIKVKPRILPSKSKQANPNLLFKAVADAQRSVTQTPSSGSIGFVTSIGGKQEKQERRERQERQEKTKTGKSKTIFVNDSKALFTKKYKEQMSLRDNKDNKTNESNKMKINAPRIGQIDKEKLRVLLKQSSAESAEKNTVVVTADYDSNFEDPLEESPVSSPIGNGNNNDNNDNDENTESETIHQETEEKVNEQQEQQFIVTLDGIKETQFSSNTGKSGKSDSSTTIVKVRRNPSPIIFEAPEIPIKPVKPVPIATNFVNNLTNLTNLANLGNSSGISAKPKPENCKYYPNCRLGTHCEYNHPNNPISTSCKNFPNCKFGDKCLYTHPKCKFQTSCTKKDCPYSHSHSHSHHTINTNAGSVKLILQQTGQQKSNLDVCKYFPLCNNLKCPYYHPKMCKYGAFCKNQSDCAFAHSNKTTSIAKGNLTWKAEGKS